MLHQPTVDKLEAMRLKGMIEAWKAQEKDPEAGGLSFAERLGLLVDHQYSWRANEALKQRLHRARLGSRAVIEDVDFRAPRGLDRQMIRALTESSAWAGRHENIFLIGPTGVGKSYLACALAQKACRDGYSALYLRATALFRELALARADGSLYVTYYRDGIRSTS